MASTLVSHSYENFLPHLNKSFEKKYYNLPWHYVLKHLQLECILIGTHSSSLYYFSNALSFQMNFLVFIGTKPNSPITRVYWDLQ